MPKNRKRCPALYSDCPNSNRSSLVMEPLKTTSEDSTELASEQSPKTLSKEEIKRIIGNCQRVLDELSSTWLSQTKKQIKDVETQIKQREQDIQRTSELFLKMHEDVAGWTSEKMKASASLKELEKLVEALTKPSLKLEELD